MTVRSHLDEEKRREIFRDFTELVNMTHQELDEWLQTDESRSVGWKSNGDSTESIGHRSGRNILRILGTPPESLSDFDYKHMQKVIGYIKRHLAQVPDRDFTNSPWRYSLMNWGHDPIRNKKLPSRTPKKVA